MPAPATDPSAPRRPWLSRNLVVLSWVSLFQDTASELLYPILPIFLTAVLGVPVAVVGIIEGLADGVASVTKLVEPDASFSLRRLAPGAARPSQR